MYDIDSHSVCVCVCEFLLHLVFCHMCDGINVILWKLKRCSINCIFVHIHDCDLLKGVHIATLNYYGKDRQRRLIRYLSRDRAALYNARVTNDIETNILASSNT